MEINNGKKASIATNMNEHDPIIERFMKEYLTEKASQGGTDKLEENELIVNFDISYGDGNSKSYTCGSESKVFSAESENYIDPKIEPEEMKCYFGEYDTNMTIESTEENIDNNDMEPERWNNCEEEWIESNSDKLLEGYEYKEKENIRGTVTVISALYSKEGNRIKGIKVNLYRLNGINPELVESKVTDYKGKAVFYNIPEGSYRVIQLIDKRYFEKPIYYSWNEVTIDSSNRESEIIAVNRIKNNIFPKNKR